jgi:hypothetical protein
MTDLDLTTALLRKHNVGSLLENDRALRRIAQLARFAVDGKEDAMTDLREVIADYAGHRAAPAIAMALVSAVGKGER